MCPGYQMLPKRKGKLREGKIEKIFFNEKGRKPCSSLLFYLFYIFTSNPILFVSSISVCLLLPHIVDGDHSYCSVMNLFCCYHFSLCKEQRAKL